MLSNASQRGRERGPHCSRGGKINAAQGDLPPREDRHNLLQKLLAATEVGAEVLVACRRHKVVRGHLALLESVSQSRRTSKKVRGLNSQRRTCREILRQHGSLAAGFFSESAFRNGEGRHLAGRRRDSPGGLRLRAKACTSPSRTGCPEKFFGREAYRSHLTIRFSRPKERSAPGPNRATGPLGLGGYVRASAGSTAGKD